MDPLEQKALSDIDEFGCHVIDVSDPDDVVSPFSYSVGIQRTAGAPEVVVIGLTGAIAHFLVNEYNRRVQEGERFAAHTCYSGFLEGFAVQFVPVSPMHLRDYFGWNRWLYEGDSFGVLQLVYPTTDGVWPWDEKASESFRRLQPLLALRADDGAAC